MGYKNAATFDALRSVVYSSLTTSYVAVGSELPSSAVCVAFTNNTNGIVYVSTDGITDMLAIPASTGKVFDIRTNAPNSIDYLFPQGTSFLVKYSGSAPTSGSFYIEAVITQI
jgi:hypothetical protein